MQGTWIPSLVTMAGMFSFRRFKSLNCTEADPEAEETTSDKAAVSTAAALPLLAPTSSSLARKISSCIVARCERWVCEQWATPATPIIAVHANPGIARGDPAFERFQRALTQESLDLDREESYVFGWHGTAEANIASICHDGFDVELRKGQQYGPGEYFGWTNGTSIGYCRDGNLLLVCLILKGRWTNLQPGTAIVVRNPPGPNSPSYCLPLCRFYTSMIPLRSKDDLL